jgi:type IV secretory pathway TraG/TraD family ATPase VirD4
MKLKMRFEKKDMQRFGIYAILLFIVVVLVMSNIRAVSSGRPLGLTFIALEGEAIAGTLVVYLFTLFGLVWSCKSYFFEFEKGWGFTTEKKMDGYSKWADKKAMQKELKPIISSEYNTKYAGIPLINDGKTLWVDDGEYHNLIIGSTGSGKTQTIIFPLVEVLAKHNESMVITDPKGEIYQKKAAMLKKRGYKIVLLNFRSPGQGNAWNPLTIPYKLW